MNRETIDKQGKTSAKLGAIKAGAAASGLALFVLLLYAQLLFTNRVAANGDILYYFYPYRGLAADALREGSILLWNPYIFMGAPFLANPQAAALYPLHWPLSWLPVTAHVYWSAALHTWLLGLGGYALLRAWRVDFWSSLVGGLVLAGSGFYGGLLGHLNQMNGAAWLPWAALILERTRQSLQPSPMASPRPVGWFGAWFLRAGLPAVGGLGALVMLMLLAGHTQTVYINLFGLGAWAVAGGLWAGWHVRGRHVRGSHLRGWLDAARPVLMLLAVMAAACGVGVLASAAQLLPTLELSDLGLRSGGLSYAEASSFSLRPLFLGWSLLPSYGLVDLSVVFATLGYTEYVAHVGTPGLALAIWAGIVGIYGLRRAAHKSPIRATTRAAQAEQARQTHLRWAWAFGLFFAALGLFLALGRWNPIYYLLYHVVPGFDLFRAPARWMMLYTLGMAMLAGLGCSYALASLRARLPRRAQAFIVALVVLVGGELLLAARALPHTQLTAPQAVYDMRTATAHLLTDPRRAEIGPGGMGRFLSMSDISFDPGDMADYRRIFAQDASPNPIEPALDEPAFTDLIVALKAQEILAPNLAMLRHIPGVDGFDGGTLPLQRYNEFLTLLIPPDALVPDGRVREQLQQIPPSNLLSLLNVEYVITDKLRDLWFEGVYYDRQIGATLDPNTGDLAVESPYAFPATHVDVIAYVTNAENNAQQEIPLPLDTTLNVAEIAVYNGDEQIDTLTLTAGNEPGAHLADNALDSPAAQAARATVAYRDVENQRQEYRARLPLNAAAEAPDLPPYDPSAYIDRLVLNPQAEDISVVIQAITLFDARTEMFLALLPSDRGRFQLAHSGDVKVYAHQDALPRAYLVPQAVAVDDAQGALHTLAQPDFDPAQFAVLENPVPQALLSQLAQTIPADGAIPAEGANAAEPENMHTQRMHAQIIAYHAEEVIIEVETAQPALLVLSDVYYPGWRATIDGQTTPIYRANHLFRAVFVPPGAETVVFQFRPQSYTQGLWLSGAGVVLLMGLLGIGWAVRKSPRFVRLRSAPDV